MGQVRTGNETVCYKDEYLGNVIEQEEVSRVFLLMFLYFSIEGEVERTLICVGRLGPEIWIGIWDFPEGIFRAQESGGCERGWCISKNCY